MKVEVDIKPFLKAINEFRTPEQQPCGVQVVEGISLKKPLRNSFQKLKQQRHDR